MQETSWRHWPLRSLTVASPNHWRESFSSRLREMRRCGPWRTTSVVIARGMETGRASPQLCFRTVEIAFWRSTAWSLLSRRSTRSAGRHRPMGPLAFRTLVELNAQDLIDDAVQARGIAEIHETIEKLPQG